MEPKIPGGFILLSRRIIESEIWDKPPLYLKVWIYLLARAQHKQFKGLKRGQLITSIPEIQEACSWHVGARKVTPTHREVRNVLDWMRGKSAKSGSRNPLERHWDGISNSNMIDTTKVTHGLLITIENYDLYQTASNYERHTESHIEQHDETPSNVTAASQYKQEYIDDDDDKWWESLAETETERPDVAEVRNYFIQKLQRFPTMDDLKLMQELLDKGFTVEKIKRGIDHAIATYKPRFNGDKINSFLYCAKVIQTLYAKQDKPNGGWKPRNYNEPARPNVITEDTVAYYRALLEERTKKRAK